MIDLQFKDVSKKYFVRRESEPDADAHPLVRKLRALRLRRQEYWAVRDVSFEVRRGEALGIIGHNGAGKSTILKLLSNITTPTSGEIMINGRLSALIEVGSGFHPELTGRENIYLNGSILGMRRREITEKLDSIVDFAGVSQFIDAPVKRYSSGMYVRLGFSIAAHLDPDILLLDEVLAVGDAAFQAKCLQRINELRQAGTTIVFISHDLGAVEGVCDRVLLMQQGKIAAIGAAHDVIAEYQRSTTTLVSSKPSNPQSSAQRKKVDLVSITFSDSEGCEALTFFTGEPLTTRIEYVAHERVREVVFGVYIHSLDGADHCQFTTNLNNESINLESGPGAIEFSCAELGLQPGSYYADIAVEQYGESDFLDAKYHCTSFRVNPGKIVWGSFYTSHQWRLEHDNSRSSKANGEQEFDDFTSSQAF